MPSSAKKFSVVVTKFIKIFLNINETEMLGMIRTISTVTGILLASAALAAPLNLTPVQQNIMGALLLDDAAAFLSGGDAMGDYSAEAQVADIKDVSKAYDENQVAGDMAYLDKRLVVSGAIESINSGIGNAPYVVFKAKQFMGPQAHFAKDKIAEVAKLKKGQSVTFVCIGGGAIAGTPIFKRCDSTETLVASLVEQKQKEVTETLSGGDGSQLARELIAISIAAEAILPKENKCSTTSKQCVDQVKTIFGNKKNEAKLKTQVAAARKSMLDAGITADAPEEKAQVKS